jgi:hypothetical protein
MVHEEAQTVGEEWVGFPGGELEGKRPKALCLTCREALRASRLSRPSRLLCFQCYRADLDRARALQAARNLDTASEARFQFQLPFEPVDRPRLQMLKVGRAAARATTSSDARFADRRRHAQIDARNALQRIAADVTSRRLAAAERDRAMAFAIRAAELQLPEAWLPFVVAR